MRERCTVSLELVAKAGIDPREITAFVGVPPTNVREGQRQSKVWALILKGPSPVSARRVANDLARDLLHRVGAAGRSRESWTEMRRAHDTEVRFLFTFGRLLNFSYELDPDVVQGLAGLDALISFHHEDDLRGRAPMDRFGSGASPDEGCDVSLRISGEGFDPDVATSRLAVRPSSTGRKGEPVGPRSNRVHSRSFWLLDGLNPCSPDADEPIAKLLDRLPTKSEAWTSLSRDWNVQVMVAFRVRQMTGHFDLDATTMSKLADCGCGLAASFFDWGPDGADLL